MDIASKKETMNYIKEEDSQKIHDSISSALNEYQENYKELKHKHSTRTDSSIIHDLIEYNVKKNFQGRTDIHYGTNKNCFKLLVGNDDIGGKYYIIRFKKLNKSFLANRNIPKQKETGFEQLTLISPCINLNAGYYTDGLQKPHILITCPTSTKANEWVWELDHTEGTEVIKYQQQDMQQTTRRPKPKEKRLEENAT